MKQQTLHSKLVLFLWGLLFAVFPISAQQSQIVKGRVLDAKSGESLIGVTVAVPRTTQGTVTDLDGYFTLSMNEASTLEISYVGYITQQVESDFSKEITIYLSEDAINLEEIVVVGYGTQKKQDLTGSVAVVDMDEASKLISSNVAEKLQGQVAGVSVQSSGDPGSTGVIRIRGIGSFSNAGPLYVIDGLIVNDMNHINSSDIESIQVLKDASSTAIYGSRGSNGVIIITTKRAKEGKPSLEFTASYGVQELSNEIKMKNVDDFLYYNELAYINAGMEWPAHLVKGDTISNSDFNKEMFQLGTTQDYNLSYSIGTENLKMVMGGGYYNQEGVLKGPNYERFTYRVNTDSQFGIFKIGQNLTLSHSKQKHTNTGVSSFTDALLMPPVIPIYNPNEESGRGGYGYGSSEFPTYASNPVAIQEGVDNNSVNNRILANVYAELELFEGLTYRFNGGVDYWNGRQKIIDYAYTVRMGSVQTKYENALRDIRDERATTILENTLTYKNTFGKHTLEALAGYTYENNKWHYLSNEGYDQKVASLWQIDLVGTQNNMWGSQQENRMTSYLGRLNYNYDNRYLVQVNFRSDASSKFGPDRRRGYFPSGSFGWRINQEEFFEPLEAYVSDLKFRASYGKIGDMQALTNYGYIPSIDNSGPYEGFYAITGPSGNETIHEGALQSSRVNTMLGWETKTTFNMGLDFSLLNDRLYGSAEYFHSISSDLLVELPLAWANGIDKEWTNYGEMKNTGIEVLLGWRDNVGDFSYNVSANISTVNNEVLKLGDSYREGGWNQVNRTEEGRSIGDFYLLETDGIFQSMDEVLAHTTILSNGTVQQIQPSAAPGDVRYVDTNQDGKIDLDDRKYMGSPLPQFEAGLNITAAYKGIDFTAFFNSRYGNKIFNSQRYSLEQCSVNNIPEDISPWTWDNPSSTSPRPYAGSTDNHLFQVDRFLEDGSYLRLKNLQIGYTLPQIYTKKIGVNTIRFYASAQNLFTLTAYKGYDPEIASGDVFGQGNDWGGYPPVRSYNVGAQITF